MANERILITKKTTIGAPALSSLEDGEMCWNVPEKQMYIRDGNSIETQGLTIAQVNALILSGGGVPSTYEISNSGRFYLESDSRWVTSADDNYGHNGENAAESAGTGTNPIVEWEHLGFIIPKGKKVKGLRIKGRANNLEIHNIEIRVIIKYPNPISRNITGIDNDNEVTSQTISNFNWKELTNTGAINDQIMKTIDIDFTAPEDCDIGLYIKPTRTGTARRSFMATWNYVIEN